MPKQLIIAACLINFGNDRGGVHCEAGEVVDVPKATAIDLARMGRTLFVDKADDPDKNGVHTASKDMLKAAADMRATRAKAAAAPADGDGNTQA
jgi:hypothetical protein